MKNQALFSSKDKSKKLKCRLLQFLFGALRVKPQTNNQPYNIIHISTMANIYNHKTPSGNEPFFDQWICPSLLFG